VWKEFNELWKGASSEIFRLQLLNVYCVEEEQQAFALYKEGKPIDLDKISGFDEWLSGIERKVKSGVKITNVNVVDLPLSEYMRFLLLFFLKTSEKGKEDMLVERKSIQNMLAGATDFWMFDRRAVIAMRYDEEGHFLGMEKATTDPGIVQKCVDFEGMALRYAKPLSEFIRSHDIEL
jgi:hypothetical protein